MTRPSTESILMAGVIESENNTSLHALSKVMILFAGLCSYLLTHMQPIDRGLDIPASRKAEASVISQEGCEEGHGDLKA